jgi:hypothetical protein
MRTLSETKAVEIDQDDLRKIFDLAEDEELLYGGQSEFTFVFQIRKYPAEQSIPISNVTLEKSDFPKGIAKDIVEKVMGAKKAMIKNSRPGKILSDELSGPEPEELKKFKKRGRRNNDEIWKKVITNIEESKYKLSVGQAFYRLKDRSFCPSDRLSFRKYCQSNDIDITKFKLGKAKKYRRNAAVTDEKERYGEVKPNDG